MKVSEVTLQIMKDYMRVDYDDDNQQITAIMAAAKSYIMGYTGLSAESIDEKPDITVAFQVLINEMYSQRQLTVDKDKVNMVVSTILGMHCINLL